MHMTSTRLRSDFAQGAEGAQKRGRGRTGGAPGCMGRSLLSQGVAPFSPGFRSPACSCCTLAAAWLGPVHNLGERQRQVRSWSTSPAPVLQAPSPHSRAGRETCCPLPASPALALGTGLQLPRAGSELLLHLGFYSGKH